MSYFTDKPKPIRNTLCRMCRGFKSENYGRTIGCRYNCDQDRTTCLGFSIPWELEQYVITNRRPPALCAALGVEVGDE